MKKSLFLKGASANFLFNWFFATILTGLPLIPHINNNIQWSLKFDFGWALPLVNTWMSFQALFKSLIYLKGKHASQDLSNEVNPLYKKMVTYAFFETRTKRNIYTIDHLQITRKWGFLNCRQFNNQIENCAFSLNWIIVHSKMHFTYKLLFPCNLASSLSGEKASFI